MPFPLPVDLPDPGVGPDPPVSPALQADSLPAEPLGKPNQALLYLYRMLCFRATGPYLTLKNKVPYTSVD